jgi:hypothetical protein
MSEPEQLTKLRRKLNAKTREIEALVASTYGLRWYLPNFYRE